MNKVENVQLFAVGTWNGTKITRKHLDDMVMAFKDNREHYRPYMKLGHNNQQRLLEADGLPAAGWIDNLYINDEEILCGDFIHVPGKIYELLQKRAYSKVSCEVYFNTTINKKKYSAVLDAVALLGGDTPAVQTLDDILGLYKKMPAPEGFEAKQIYSEIKFAFTDASTNNEKHQGDNPMPQKTEREIELENEVTQLKADKAAADKAAGLLKDKDAEIAKFKADKEKAEKELLESQKAQKEAEQKQKQTEREAFAAKLVSNKLATPAMKPMIEQLLDEDKKEFSIKDEKGKDKTASRGECLESVLKLFAEAKKVNFSEQTTETTTVEESQEDEAAQNEKIEKYMTDHKVDYKTAFKALFSKGVQGSKKPVTIEE